MADQTTTIPKGWQKLPINDLVDIVVDNRGRNPDYYVLKGVPVIDNVLIKGERKINLGEARRFIDNDTYSSFIRKYNQENDVLITLVGNGYGNVALSPKGKSIIMQNTIGLRCNDSGDNVFLFYNLSLNKKLLADLNIGAAQPSIKVGDLLSVELIIPPISEQRAIAAVLSSLDDKIELLREQNKTLEATAQAIFKEWFVNFNFPGATGKMIDSEIGKIPEGWRVKKFGDIFKIEYGKSDKKFDGDGEFPVYGAGGIVGYSNSNDYQGYQIIVGCRGTCGNITLAYEDSKITHNSLVVANEWFKPFSYLFLQTIDIKRAITGSTQPQITIGDLANIEIYVPEDLIIKLFSENIKSIFEKIKNNSSQIQTLSSLRDILLPKLMKGEIRVKGFKD